MQRRRHDSIREGVPWARLLAVAGLAGAAGTALLAGPPGDQPTVAAGLLFLGDVRRRSGLTKLVGSLVGGSLLGAALGYAATIWLAGFPLAIEGGVGLGIALGGGIGVVSNLLAADARDDGGADAESMTVDMQTDDSPSPRPADLFDDHPDPVLYVADHGHGPVVLAANEAFSDTFDVPADAMSETPLEEALMAADDAAGSSKTGDVVDAVTTDTQIDAVLRCQTPGGETGFRLRTAGSGADGYVIYTKTDREA